MFYFFMCCLRSALCYEKFYRQTEESEIMSKSSVPNDIEIEFSVLCSLDETDAMLYASNNKFTIDAHKNQDQNNYEDERQQIEEICPTVRGYKFEVISSQSRSRSRSNPTLDW